MRFPALHALLAATTWLVACGLEESGGAESTGGSAGSQAGSGGTAAIGGSSGGKGGTTGGIGGTGGTSGTGGIGGTGGTGGASGGGAAGGGGVAGTQPTGGTGGVASETILSMTVKIGIDHGRLGNLTIKLTSPGGKVCTLMSRPGFAEVADDGSTAGVGANGSEGDATDLASDFPITFDDTASVDAETMGTFIESSGLAVCRDSEEVPGGPGGKVCVYHTNPDKAGGPPTLTAAFAGSSPVGAWKLCVGDSDFDGTGPGVGSLVNWQLEFLTTAGPRAPLGVTGQNLVIVDDGYPGQTTCHTLTVP